MLISFKKRTLILLLPLFFLLTCSSERTTIKSYEQQQAVINSKTQASKKIMFSGYEWNVRNGRGGPGDNYWSAKNVSVDDDGLHLKISRDGDDYSCAEVYTTEAFGFGSYQFQIVGRIDNMNENVVLGLFNFSRDSQSRTNEIDIEFSELSKWKKNGNAIYSVYPSKLIKGYKNSHKEFNLKLNGSYSTHRFKWDKDCVTFQSLHGHTDHDDDEIILWEYSNDEESDVYIPQQPLPVHINLWLHKNDELELDEFEVVIKEFKFNIQN